jgi:hypothetical protein
MPAEFLKAGISSLLAAVGQPMFRQWAPVATGGTIHRSVVSDGQRYIAKWYYYDAVSSSGVRVFLFAARLATRDSLHPQPLTFDRRRVALRVR